MRCHGHCCEEDHLPAARFGRGGRDHGARRRQDLECGDPGCAAVSRQLRLQGELRSLQGYWSKKAQERGILTEKALERYLEE